VRLRLFIIISIVLLMVVSISARLTYDALIRSAKIYLQQKPKDFDSAREKLEEAIQSYPDKPPIEAHAALGEIHAEKRRYAEMNENFDAAMSYCADPQEKDIKKVCEKEDIVRRIKGVRQSVWINEFNEGAQTLGEARDLKEELEEVEDEDEIEEINEDIQMIYRAALTNFVNATVIIPDSAAGWINMGISYYNLGIRDSAITAYNTALGYHPENFDLISNMATIYFEMEDWEKCSEMFGRMAALQPDNVSVLKNSSMLLRQLEMSDSARVLIDKVIEIDPDDVEMRTQRGFMEVAHGADLNDTINKLKTDDEVKHKAEIAELTDLRDEAYRMVVVDFGKVTEIEPENFDAFYYLGLCYYFLEEYESSRDAWIRATEIQPDAVDVWELLAPLHLKLKDRKSAEAAQKKADSLKALEG